MNRSVYSFLLLFSVLVLLYSCGNKSTSTSSSNIEKKANFQYAKLLFPNGICTLTAGDSLNVIIQPPDSEYLDSINLYWDNEFLSPVEGDALSLSTQGLPLGIHSLRLFSWKGGESRVAQTTITLLAGDEPKQYVYRVIKEYPHDPAAYTQGLLIAEGIMYESAGQRGMSSLRKLDIRTGRVLQELSLDPSYFAEGLAMFAGKLYQLTWTSSKCFQYDAESFNREQIHYYSGQGWGLTADDKFLYMTDGSERVFVRDPHSFEVIRTLQVFDHEGKVRMLNELELIDGLLYANVYMTDDIVAIDLRTGAVVKRISLAGLLPDRLRDRSTDVLNGIAYDHESKRTYVTGKNWPRLYEVEFVAR